MERSVKRCYVESATRRFEELEALTTARELTYANKYSKTNSTFKLKFRSAMTALFLK
jgi:hypothetical protein